MNKLDETNALFDKISELDKSGEIAFHHKTVGESILLDIAKSLAIIADSMNKEE